MTYRHAMSTNAAVDVFLRTIRWLVGTFRGLAVLASAASGLLLVAYLDTKSPTYIDVGWPIVLCMGAISWTILFAYKLQCSTASVLFVTAVMVMALAMFPIMMKGAHVLRAGTSHVNCDLGAIASGRPHVPGGLKRRG